MQFIGDVSSHNNITDWSRFKAETQAVWVKATQASGRQDGYVNLSYPNQAGSAHLAGVLTGAYHFADVRFGGTADAEFFVANAGPPAFADGALLPMLDVENTAGVTWTGTNAPAYVKAWRDEYRRLTGRRKFAVYASRSFWQTIMHPEQWADSDTYMIVAAYGLGSPTEQQPNRSGWSHPRLAAWQYTDAWSTPASPRPLDRSVLVNFSLAELTLGSVNHLIEGDDDVAPQPVLFLAGAVAGVNNGQPLFPYGVWRDEFGTYVGLESAAEAHNLLAAFPGSPKNGSEQGISIEQATLAELVRVSRVGIDTPVPTAGTGTGGGTGGGQPPNS